MKKFITLLCVCTLCAATCLGITACGTKNADALTYVSLRINPQIELVADSHGTVLSVSAENEDGEVVLSNLILEGQTTEEASEAFAQEAAELGYIDVDSEKNEVFVSVEREDDEQAEKTKKKLTEKLNKFFENNGIYGIALQETFEQYKEQAATWGISPGHTKMVIRILNLYPEMTPEEILALPINERVALIKDNSKNNGMHSALKEQYKAAINQLKIEYASMFELEKEIAELKEQLNDSALTVEQKTLIENEIKAKEEQFKTLHMSYKAEMEEIKLQYKQKTDEAKKESKAAHQAKKEANANKVKEHKEKFEKNKKNIKEDIEKWHKKEGKL